MKKNILAAAAALGALGAQANDSFYNLSFTTLEGKEYRFEQLRGKFVLIVNTASACGYTKQYAGLQELWQQYGSKLVVLGFPCNQFGGQEKGDGSEIAAFCSKNYGVTFPLMQKSDVKGKNQNNVFQWLTNKDKNGWNTQEPTWNFCKYLIDAQGNLVQFFPSKVEPLSADITNLINAAPANKHTLIKQND
jgi:glutathione peroxidase